MEVKKITEGMTATQVSEVIDSNFKGIKEETDAKLSELGQKVFNYNHFVGKGATFSDVKLYGFTPNRKYEVRLLSSWENVEVPNPGSSYKFIVSAWLNGVETKLAFRTIAQDVVEESYIITTPNKFDYIQIGGRAISGEKIFFSIYDADQKAKFEDLSKSINSLNKTVDTLASNQSSIGANVGEIETQLLNNYFKGKGLTYVSRKVIGLIPNNRYRIYFAQGSWNLDTIGSTAFKFAVSSFVGTQETRLVGVSGNANIKPYYDFTTPEEFDYISVGGRAANEDIIRFTIINRDEVSKLKIDMKSSEHEILDSIVNGKQSNYESGRRFNAEGGISSTNANGWNVVTEYIPVKPTDSILWRIGDVTNSAASLIVYDSNKEFLNYYTANVTPFREIKISSLQNAAYIRLSFYDTYSGERNITPVYINDVPYYIREEIVGQRQGTDRTHGKIGENYPQQIKDIEVLLNNSNYGFDKRFHFIHVSDNHSTDFGYADELLDLCPALFLVNTGDMLLDTFADLGSSKTVNLATSTQKPCYLVLGNHDYCKAPSKQAVFDAFMQPTHAHNGVDTDKTYYSVDYAEYGVKCIMLDMNDGYADSEYANLGATTLTRGNMSNEQILWFIEQLEYAKANNLHICLFMHVVPCQIDSERVISDFSDYNNCGSPIASNLPFLADIIDAWIEGTNVSFNYKSVDYNHTFNGKGHFVSWFFGHLHWDECGWMQDHPNQFMCGVCRPVAGYTGFGSYDGDKLGVHFNFYTIDTFLNSLSVYRVGQQDTVYATKRKSFRIRYK